MAVGQCTLARVVYAYSSDLESYNPVWRILTVYDYAALILTNSNPPTSH